LLLLFAVAVGLSLSLLGGELSVRDIHPKHIQGAIVYLHENGIKSGWFSDTALSIA
jgi:hypothetical protein